MRYLWVIPMLACRPMPDDFPDPEVSSGSEDPATSTAEEFISSGSTPTTGSTGSTPTTDSTGSSDPVDLPAGAACPVDADCIPGTRRCPASCYRHRYAFVTSVDLRGYEIGGTDKADMLCNHLAVGAGLFTADEIYKHPMRAWLSRLGDNAKGEVPFGKGHYYQPLSAQEELDGMADDDPSLMIVESFDDLLLPLFVHPLDRTEVGKEVYGYAWTNTSLKGEAVSLEKKGSCNYWNEWCIVNSPCEGLVGKIGSVDESWTVLDPPVNFSNCGEENNLYCFEWVWDPI